MNAVNMNMFRMENLEGCAAGNCGSFMSIMCDISNPVSISCVIMYSCYVYIENCVACLCVIIDCTYSWTLDIAYFYCCSICSYLFGFLLLV